MVFVMILMSQFDNLMGLQFLSTDWSLPSLGINLRYDDLCDVNNEPVSIEYNQESNSNGPYILLVFNSIL